MFLFDAAQVLSLTGTGFTDRNFAIGSVTPSFDEAGFDQIDFNLVYHDSAPPRNMGDEIRRRRMAEVVVPTELALQDNLKLIVCRTAYDVITLKYLLGNQAARWDAIIIAESIPQSIFMHMALYIRSISPTDDGISIILKPPTDLAIQSCAIRVSNPETDETIWQDLNAPLTHTAINIPIANVRDRSQVRIDIDEALAFCGPLPTLISELL
jgi:hypothetical protein